MIDLDKLPWPEGSPHFTRQWVKQLDGTLKETPFFNSFHNQTFSFSTDIWNEKDRTIVCAVAFLWFWQRADELTDEDEEMNTEQSFQYLQLTGYAEQWAKASQGVKNEHD